MASGKRQQIGISNAPRSVTQRSIVSRLDNAISHNIVPIADGKTAKK